MKSLRDIDKEVQEFNRKQELLQEVGTEIVKSLEKNNERVEQKEATEDAIHEEWLRNPETIRLLRKLEDLRESSHQATEVFSLEYNVDNKAQCILDRVIRTRTIREIINFLKKG